MNTFLRFNRFPGLAATIAAGALALSSAGDALGQTRDPFRPMLDPRHEARDPRDVGNRNFFRREFDPRVDAADPLRAGNREPLSTGVDPRERARDTVRPAVDAVPIPRLPAPAEVELQRLDDVRAVDLGLELDASGGDALLVARIAPQAILARAGIRAGDRIVSVNNVKVAREADFLRYLLAEDTRDEILPIVVIRDDQEQMLDVEPALVVAQVSKFRPDPLAGYGLRVTQRDPDTLVVTSVRPRSPAFVAGLKPGDVILTFDERTPLNREDLAAWIEAAGADPVSLTVHRSGRPVALEWEADIAMDATGNPAPTTTVPDRKALERLSKLRERREMMQR